MGATILDQGAAIFATRCSSFVQYLRGAALRGLPCGHVGDPYPFHWRLSSFLVKAQHTSNPSLAGESGVSSNLPQEQYHSSITLQGKEILAVPQNKGAISVEAARQYFSRWVRWVEGGPCVYNDNDDGMLGHKAILAVSVKDPHPNCKAMAAGEGGGVIKSSCHHHCIIVSIQVSFLWKPPPPTLLPNQSPFPGDCKGIYPVTRPDKVDLLVEQKKVTRCY